MTTKPTTPPLESAPAESVDLTKMARFLVLPGAVTLLDAFSRIPPGSLRQSIIDHAMVIAETYAGAPAEMQMPDPLLTAARVSGYAPALPPPPVRRRSGAGIEERVVELRIEGKRKSEIAENLGIAVLKVEAILKAATRAGVKFPPLPKGTPKGGHDQGNFPTRLEELGGGARAQMERAALARGVSLESYLDARRTLVELRRAQKPMSEIAAATKMDEKTLWGWLYTARRCGIDLPLTLDYDEAEIAAPAAGKTGKKPAHSNFALEFVPATSQHRMIVQAAADIGVDFAAYYALRRAAVRLFREGLTGPQAGVRLGIGARRGQNWLFQVKRAGMLDPGFVVPPEPATGASPREATSGPETTETAVSGDPTPPEEGFEITVASGPRPDPDGDKPTRFFETLDKLGPGQRFSVEKAAAKRGITPQAYLDLRESVVLHRMRGKGPAEIAVLVGEKAFFVKDLIDAARSRGAIFPPVNANPFEATDAEVVIAPRKKRAAG